MDNSLAPRTGGRVYYDQISRFGRADELAQRDATAMRIARLCLWSLALAEKTEVGFGISSNRCARN